MGLDVLIASRGEHSLISEVHDGLHIDLDDQESALAHILDESRKNPFVGVLGSDDSTVELAANVAYKLGLPHNPPQAARLTRRKDLARKHLKQSGCPVPAHHLLNLGQPLEQQLSGIPWPGVIKPLNMSASRGVIRVNNKAELIEACERVKNIIRESNTDFEKTHILFEEYIDGVEVAYEGYLHQGELTTLVLFDKPDPLVGPYFEETIYVAPSVLNDVIQAKIKSCVAQVCKAYGLVTGPVHAELRINHHDVWILEIACRTIGGECARSLDDEGSFNLEELTISLAINSPVTTCPPQEARGVMMIPIKQGGLLRRVEGLSDAIKTANIKKVDIIVRTGSELIPLPEGNQYPGYIFARAETPCEVIHALKEAYEKLNFVVAPVIKLRAN